MRKTSTTSRRSKIKSPKRTSRATRSKSSKRKISSKKIGDAVILHLEPSKRTTLYRQLVQFFNTSEKKYGPTDASAYHPHCSMTGYFGMAGDDYRISTIDSVIKKWKRRYKAIPPPLVTGILMGSTGQSIRLHLQTSPEYMELLVNIQQALTATPSFTGNFRPKKLDHISLAYFYKENARRFSLGYKRNFMNRMLPVAQKILGNLFPHQRAGWDIVYYKLEKRATAPLEGERNILTQLGRWKIA